MIIDKPNIGDLETQYIELCNQTNSNNAQPFHKTSLMEYKKKYLGHYITLVEKAESGLSLNNQFEVFDLYVYEGSKFTGRTFIAVYGDNQTDYISQKESNLMTIPNKELSTFAVGEAYRRFLKRKPIYGNIVF